VLTVSLIASIYIVAADRVVDPETTLLVADTILLAVEAAVVLSYLYLVRASLAAKASVELLLRGELAPAFWLGFITCGLVIPLAMEAVLLGPMDDAGPAMRLVATTVAVVPALLGGYLLRHLVLTAAIKSPLVVIGRLAPIPASPRLVT
jgi:formate-dependent nitrite reductase membrane component NrfD